MAQPVEHCLLDILGGCAGDELTRAHQCPTGALVQEQSRVVPGACADTDRQRTPVRSMPCEAQNRQSLPVRTPVSRAWT